jgi:hypothetical protein
LNEKHNVSQQLFNAPLAFEKNDGQFDAHIRFVARSAGGVTYYFSDNGISIALHKSTANNKPVAMQERQPETTLSDVLFVSFPNVNATPQLLPKNFFPQQQIIFWERTKANGKQT